MPWIKVANSPRGGGFILMVLARLCIVLLLLTAIPVHAEDVPKPFAANLFTGNFAKGTGTAVCESGDCVVLRLWGESLSVDTTLVVAGDGNINVPEIGTVQVAGLAHDKIVDALKSKLQAAGHGGAQIYVAPLDTRPVTVFVTGCVEKPGTYQSSAQDSVLAFLDKAGGVSAGRGSYRDIVLMRNGQKTASFDLYPFVRSGILSHVRFKDGDTIVVGKMGPTVTATGVVRNQAVFEFPAGQVSGKALMELAAPEGRATHVTITGTRNGVPYNTYIPLRNLAALQLRDGDSVQFSADVAGRTILVQVEGAVKGAARFPVRQGARLSEVINFISVEPTRARLDAMYIKRKSVAARQKKAIQESLRRLEESAMTAPSQSTEEAGIRAKEAENISKFVAQAKQVEPEGIVVLDKKSDITLENGDIIVIPPKSDVVLVTGEVMMPQAMVWGRKKMLKTM